MLALPFDWRRLVACRSLVTADGLPYNWQRDKSRVGRDLRQDTQIPVRFDRLRQRIATNGDRRCIAARKAISAEFDRSLDAVT
ncbi:MAG: hypothetical protein D6741_16565 [Planctomycetota bacterium]|nr:MAG: hypothetical protein D6741_16565 [Planctomycetota bacterium]